MRGPDVVRRREDQRVALTGTVRRQPLRESSARTYARALPIVPVRARGMTVEGADGRRYLDCLSGDGALALGHNHPVVLAAVREVLDSGAPIGVLDLSTPVEERFLAELLATLPPGLARCARVRFCGPTVADALALAAGPAGGAGGVVVESGVVVEPVSDDRLRRLRESTRERGVPLVVDETVTGVGRTGAFWAVEHSGVTPDVMVLAKAIGGSLPLAVVVHREDLDLAPAAGPPADVPRGNQLAMAAGAATLAHVREQRLAARAGEVGARMLRRLRSLAAGHRCVGEVGGRGLMLGLAFVDPASAPAPEVAAAVPGLPVPGLAAAVRRECLRRGLIVGIGGPHAEVVRLLPPLTVTDEQADAVLERLADAVEAAAGAARS
ncbi:aminotransferase class III-fold pyridoxal phosphate-dependent enzyme [Streptomyces abyssomicinicus]|uniref:aminotransferase class III-fold pyridoxal phosphate-dependent enzyme n=1 Tax=Streptomyces abyssomicinicus TaxID=574929 RepID=UPI0012502B11|nr:aminotransferase class III-fold pyridoxal phosphate-dependent enzyme [Streptomyces abyssomicinicus]